jgi:hypothetical protein
MGGGGRKIGRESESNIGIIQGRSHQFLFLNNPRQKSPIFIFK